MQDLRLVQVLLGWNFHRGAYFALRRGRANMDVLVSLGTTTAYLYSVLSVALMWSKARQGVMYNGPDYFETSALLITFISLGKFLEVHAKGRTSDVSHCCNLCMTSQSQCLPAALEAASAYRLYMQWPLAGLSYTAYICVLCKDHI